MTFKEPVGSWRALRMILGESGQIKAKTHCKVVNRPQRRWTEQNVFYPSQPTQGLKVVSGASVMRWADSLIEASLENWDS